VLLVCDHASPAVPASLDRLGLERDVFHRHIAYDIGAAAVTRGLARRLNAPAVLAGYSRLLIDVNRQPGDPGSIPLFSDGTQIPANHALSEQAEEERVEGFFWPYHHAVTNALAHLWRHGPPPAVFSVHTFTPSLAGGEDRRWHVGVLWNRDPRIARPLMEKLRAREGLQVGDNEPYSGLEIAYTLNLHGGAAGLPNCAIEIRQDLVTDEAGAEHWADLLADVLGEILGGEDLHNVVQF
jgi:predicted N-formylglutamate amidohydrolase